METKRCILLLMTLYAASAAVSFAQSRRQVTSLSSATLYAGLASSADVTNPPKASDFRVEVYLNGSMISSGETLCVTGLTANTSSPTAVTVSLSPVGRLVNLWPREPVSVKVFARMGTNGSGAACSAGTTAAGLRLYYDASTQNARLGMQISPATLQLNYFHTNSTNDVFDTHNPTASPAKAKTSTSLAFAGGNPWMQIGTDFAFNRSLTSYPVIQAALTPPLTLAQILKPATLSTWYTSRGLGMILTEDR